MNKGKRYQELVKGYDKQSLFELDAAIAQVKKTATAKFDETIEMHIRLGVDSHHADQQVRGAIVLPHGTGKSVKVLVIAKGDKLKDAEEAGADFYGEDDIIEKIQKENWFDFDVMIATPDMMIPLSKLGKILGPKGLMPNPKTGTVTMDVVKAINDIKKGRVEYRTDSFGNIHSIVGKVSFDDKKIKENLKYFIDTILKLKPSAVKGSYVKNVTITTTMGPGIKIDINSFDK